VRSYESLLPLLFIKNPSLCASKRIIRQAILITSLKSRADYQKLHFYFFGHWISTNQASASWRSEYLFSFHELPLVQGEGVTPAPLEWAELARSASSLDKRGRDRGSRISPIRTSLDHWPLNPFKITFNQTTTYRSWQTDYRVNFLPSRFQTPRQHSAASDFCSAATPLVIDPVSQPPTFQGNHAIVHELGQWYSFPMNTTKALDAWSLSVWSWQGGNYGNRRILGSWSGPSSFDTWQVPAEE
jgi:hypothetical protein